MRRWENIASKEALRSWLWRKPSPWAHIITSRIALRILPAIGLTVTQSHTTDEQQAEQVIAVIRANFLCIAALLYPDNNDIIINRGKAADSIVRFPLDIALRAAYSAAHADSYFSAKAADDFSEAYDKKGSIDLKRCIWSSISSDASWLEVKKTYPEPAEITQLALWHENVPEQVALSWNFFSSCNLSKEYKFDPWIFWYEKLASLDGSSIPQNIFGDPLTLRIAIQPDEWWRRPAKEINADIAAWLREETFAAASHTASKQTLAEALDALPPQQPAPYLFDWRDGRMEVLSPDTSVEDGGIAQDYLDEARDKANDLSERLNGRNFDPNIHRKVGKLLEVLPERVAGLRPALVDSRTNSLERLVGALDNPQDAAELPSDVLADLGDVADTARRLCHCLPAMWKRDVERLAGSLTADSAAEVLKQLDAVREQLREAEIVGPSVHQALATLSEDSAEPAPQDLKRRRVAMFGLTVRNLLTTLLKGGKDSSAAMAKELLRFSRDVGKELRPEAVKGVAKLIVGTGATTAAYLFITLLVPADRLSPYFPELARVVKSIQDFTRPGSGPVP